MYEGETREARVEGGKLRKVRKRQKMETDRKSEEDMKKKQEF